MVCRGERSDLMERQTKEFLKRYMETISPAGFEAEASRVWREEAERFAARTWVDLHGNSFALVNEGGSPRVMLAGHTDEIGLMISYIDDKGFLFFRGIGGWDPQILPGQRVWIKARAGRVSGVIGRKPIHLLEEEERKKVVKLEELWIDIGAKDKQEAESVVSVSDPAVLAYGFEELRGNLAAARAFDDKCGAFVVLEAARLLTRLNPKGEVYAVATVQEEVGLRGAKTSAFGIDPKVGIAVDVGFASDTPGMETDKRKVGDLRVGRGPIITRGPNINEKVFELLVEVAIEKKIPYQVEGWPKETGTDANAIQLTRAGVATGLISVANRYMHSPCELVSLEDLENAARLLAYTVERIDERTDFVPF
jgi:putative aminopeptidase FrvX